jgi:hypothetical protein
LRRAAAIYLCQIAVGGSFPHAAKLLGTPIARAEQSGRVLCRWARDSTEPRQFETALLDLADELDSASHLINYQRRREALNSWSIGPSTWQQLLRQLDPSAVHAAQELGDHGRHAATISVWAASLTATIRWLGAAVSAPPGYCHSQGASPTVMPTSKAYSTSTPTNSPLVSTAASSSRVQRAEDARHTGSKPANYREKSHVCVC